jgi:hypothetical protein
MDHSIIPDKTGSQQDKTPCLGGGSKKTQGFD